MEVFLTVASVLVSLVAIIALLILAGLILTAALGLAQGLALILPNPLAWWDDKRDSIRNPFVRYLVELLQTAVIVALVVPVVLWLLP